MEKMTVNLDRFPPTTIYTQRPIQWAHIRYDHMYVKSIAIVWHTLLRLLAYTRSHMHTEHMKRTEQRNYRTRITVENRARTALRADKVLFCLLVFFLFRLWLSSLLPMRLLLPIVRLICKTTLWHAKLAIQFDAYFIRPFFLLVLLLLFACFAFLWAHKWLRRLTTHHVAVVGTLFHFIHMQISASCAEREESMFD